MQNLTEFQIIDLLQKGDKKAISYIYEMFAQKIHNFIFYKTMDHDLSEDLVSETFLKVIDKIQTFNINKGNFSMWIYSIARHVVIDHYRKYKTTESIESAWEIKDDFTDVEISSDIKTTFDYLKPYLKNLSEEKREILHLRIWENLSFNEISNIVGKTESACKMNFKRTIEELKSKIPLNILLLLLLKQI